MQKEERMEKKMALICEEVGKEQAEFRGPQKRTTCNEGETTGKSTRRESV